MEGSYKGKIVGNQNSCCEENRKVITSFFPSEDSDLTLVVECKICNNRWIEVLD